MRTFLMLTFTAALATAGLRANSTENLNNQIDRIVAEAQAVEQHAVNLSRTLKDKRADLSKASEMTAGLKERIRTVKDLVNQIEPSVADSNREVYEKVVLKAQLLEIIANNKEQLLNREEAARKRSLLRANADGIAKRAEMLQQSALKLKI